MCPARAVSITMLLFLTLISGLLCSQQSAHARYQTGCGTRETSSQTHVDQGVPLGGPAKSGRMVSNSSFSHAAALWSHPVRVPGKPYPFSDPVFDGSSVWIVVDGQRLMAVDPLTGDSSVEFETPVGFSTHLVAANDSIIVGLGDGSVTSVDGETGAANWTTPTSGTIHGDLIATDGVVVFVTGSQLTTEQIVALDEQTGDTLWAVDAFTRDGLPFQGVRSLTASAGVVVIAGSNGLMALDEKTGQDCWRTYYWSTFGGASADDGMLFAANGQTDKLAARDILTGEILWESGVDMGLGIPAVVDGTVFFGSRDGSLYAIGARTGEAKRQFEAGDFSWAKPVVANGTVLAASKDGLLYAFDATTGAVRWTFDVGPVEYEHTAPLVLFDVIYVGSDEGFQAISVS
jgi:outer membrane protein assembly factor BamB